MKLEMAQGVMMMTTMIEKKKQEAQLLL